MIKTGPHEDCPRKPGVISAAEKFIQVTSFRNGQLTTIQIRAISGTIFFFFFKGQELKTHLQTMQGLFDQEGE